MTTAHRRRLGFAQLLSSAVLTQAVLSAASFAVGLLLIRAASALEYGYFVLAMNGLLLLGSLQNAFLAPPLAARFGALDVAGRRDLVGGLYREQRRVLPWLAACGALAAGVLWSAGIIDAHGAGLALAAAAASLATLRREYFRLVLFTLRQASQVLRADLLFVALLLGGVALALQTRWPALAIVVVVGLASATSAAQLARTLRRQVDWNLAGRPGLLREVAPQAAWSTAGAGVHWAFSQGYVYLVAGMLGVPAVAALSATRLLLMPINLVSSGVGSLMLPLASGWLRQHGRARLLRRMALLALGLAALTLVYFAITWLLRDWIFGALLRRHFPGSDLLLLLWGGIFVLMVLRDQLGYVLSAQGRFRALTQLTAVCAVVALSTSAFAMRLYGAPGALVGILVGETCNVAGILYLVTRGSAGTVQLHR